MYYDCKASILSYHSGDLVWLLNEQRRVGVATKLQPTYCGPYLVVLKLGAVNYLIQLDKAGKQRVVHHDKLKHYKGEIKLPWAKKALRATKLPPSNQSWRN